MAQPDSILQAQSQIMRTLDFQPFPLVKIAFPLFRLWVGKRDPRLLQTDEWRNQRYHMESMDHLGDIKPLLSTIAGSVIGKAVLGEFAVKSNPVFIMPWDFRPPNKNPDAGAETKYAVEYVDATEVCDADRKGPYKCVQAPSDGKSSVIFLSSAVAGSGIATASESLLHELVHTGRVSRGLSNDRPMRGNPPNSEDFLANLVENIYRMAVRNGRFLKYKDDHTGHVDVDTDSYLADEGRPTRREILFEFRNGQRSLYNALMHSHVRYNPIAQFEGEQSALAAHPDLHLRQSAG